MADNYSRFPAKEDGSEDCKIRTAYHLDYFNSVKTFISYLFCWIIECKTL